MNPEEKKFTDEAFESMTIQEKLDNISSFTDIQLSTALDEIKNARRVTPTKKSVDPAISAEKRKKEKEAADEIVAESGLEL